MSKTKSSAPTQEQVLHQLFDSKVEVSLEYLRKQTIFFATPCYGGQVTEPFFRSMMRLTSTLNHYGVNFVVSTLANESLVTRARNTMVSFFMENPNNTHLFFIDADIEFSPEDVLRMIGYDRDVVVGAYPKKAMNWASILHAARNNVDIAPAEIEKYSSNYVVNFDLPTDKKGNRLPRVQIKDNLIKLNDAGTGFMCVKRAVIQRLFDVHPELKYKNDINVDNKYEPFMYALFDTMIDPQSRRYLSEDYAFCRLWQAQDGDIWLDPRTNLNHVGHYTFRGNIRKLFGE